MNTNDLADHSKCAAVHQRCGLETFAWKHAVQGGRGSAEVITVTVAWQPTVFTPVAVVHFLVCVFASVSHAPWWCFSGGFGPERAEAARRVSAGHAREYSPCRHGNGTREYSPCRHGNRVVIRSTEVYSWLERSSDATTHESRIRLLN